LAIPFAKKSLFLPEQPMVSEKFLQITLTLKNTIHETQNLLFVSSGLTFTIKSYGQGLKLSDKPEEFLADAQNVLSVSGNPQAENIAKGFEKLWNSEKLGSPQKTKIASLSNFMFKRI
jgi:hypothetical protein